MSSHPNPVDIRSRAFWVEVVEMLQQNWALFDDDVDSKGWTVYLCWQHGRRVRPDALQR